MYATLLRLFFAGAVLMTGLPAVTHAQSSKGGITFTWGDEYELPKRHEDLGFIGNAADGYLQIGHAEHKSLSFQKFNSKLHLDGEKQVDLDNLPRDYQNEFFTQLGDKYYWFFSTYERSEGKESLYVQEIDLKSGDMKGSAREILSTTKLTGTLTATGFYRFALTDKWNFFFSFDKSKLLIKYRKKPEHRDDSRNNDVIGLFVFDAGMQKLWGREIRMPYTEEKMDNEDYQVDSRGNIYTLAKVYDERKSGDHKHPNYHFEILKWSKDKQEVTKTPFRFTDKFVSAATITEDPSGKIIAAGYYSKRRNSGSTDGVFLMKVDEATNELNNVMKGTYEFPASAMTQFESRRTRRRMERKDKRDEAEDANLVFRSIVINGDGSIQIFGEEHYIVVTTTYNGRSTSTTTAYHYDDILAMNIGSDGNLKWVQKIPKDQIGYSGLGGMSFKQYRYKDNSYLFFMDNIKNLELETDESPAQHRDGAGGILMAVRIDDAGNMTKEKIFDVREEKVTLTVTDFDDVGNNQLIVRGRARHKQSQAALITFN